MPPGTFYSRTPSEHVQVPADLPPTPDSRDVGEALRTLYDIGVRTHVQLTRLTEHVNHLHDSQAQQEQTARELQRVDAQVQRNKFQLKILWAVATALGGMAMASIWAAVIAPLIGSK